MSQTPRHVRLANEYTQLINLAARSDFMDVEPVDVQPGFPPEKYIITYTCRGVADIDQSGAPRFADFHQARIYLPSDYPLREPYVKWLTPIWHPNIEHIEPHSVCTNTPRGHWMNHSLADLVLMMGEMVQYKRYYAIWERPLPVDRDAAKWVREYAEMRKLITHDRPIDERPLVRSRYGRADSEFMRRPPSASGAFREQRPSGRTDALRAGGASERFITHKMMAAEQGPDLSTVAPEKKLPGPSTVWMPAPSLDGDSTAPFAESEAVLDSDPTDPLAGVGSMLSTLDPNDMPDWDRDPTDRLSGSPPEEALTYDNLPMVQDDDQFDGAKAPTTPGLELPPTSDLRHPEAETFVEDQHPEAPAEKQSGEDPASAGDESSEESPPRLVHGMRRRTGMLTALPPNHDVTNDERGVPRSALAPTFYLPSVLGRKRSGPMFEDARECSSCGRPVSLAAAFCPYCGASAPTEAEDSWSESEQRGAVTKVDEKSSAARVSGRLPLRAAVRRFCHWCGQGIVQSAVFCPHCGKSLVKRS